MLLHQKYDHCFFTINTELYDWIRNFFSANVQLSVNEKLSLPVRESFLELRSDRTLRLKFSVVLFDEFWISVEDECKRILKVASEILLQSCTTYLCEQSLSSY